MRRRLNVKLVAYLFVGMLIFGVSVHFIHGYQVRKNANGLIERAKEAREEGKPAESVRLLARYLMHFPESPEIAKQAALEAKTNLFDAWAARKETDRRQITSTVSLIESAGRVAPFDEELKRESADFWFKINRWSDAIDLLNDIEKQAKKDVDQPPTGRESFKFTVEDKLRRIESLRRIGSPTEEEQAITQLSEMLGLDSRSDEFDEEAATDKDQVDAYRSLAQLMMSRRMDNTMALATLDQMVKVCQANPDNEIQSKAFLNRSAMIRYLIKGDAGKEKWISDVNEAYQRDGDNLSCIAAMAQMYMELGEHDAAKEFIRSGLNQADMMHQKSSLYNLLVKVHLAQNDTAGANQVLEEAISAVPKDPELLWKKARLVLDDAVAQRVAAAKSAQAGDSAASQQFDELARKQFLAVENMFRPMRQARVDEPRIEYLKSRILMQRDGDVHRATKQLAAIREMVTGPLRYDIDVYLNMGYAQTRQYDLQLEAIRRMLSVRPGSVTAHESYIRTLMSMKRNKEALDYAEDLVRKIETNEGEVSSNIKGMLVQLRVTAGTQDSNRELTEAEMLALRKQVQDNYRDESIPLQQRTAIAIDYFSKIKDQKSVMALINRALKDDPTSFPFHSLRLNYAENKEQAVKFFKEMQQNVDRQKYGVAMLPMQAKLAVKYDKDNASKLINQIAQAATQYPNEQQAALLFELGTLQIAFLNERVDGLALLEKAATLAPRRLDILQMLYQEASTQPDSKRLDEIVDRIEKVTGKDDDSYRMVKAGRILWGLDKGKYSEEEKPRAISQARQLVQRAKQNRPDFMPLMLMYARVQLADGDLQSALSTLQDAHKRKPSDANVIRRVVQIYKALGQPKLESEWRLRLPKSARGIGDIREQLQGLAATQATWTAADQAQALRLAENLTSMSTAAPQDWMMKSRILALAGRIENAVEAANGALRLDSSNVDSWTNLLRIVGSNKAKSAEQKQADYAGVLKRIPNEVPAAQQPVVLGRSYQLLGQYPEAEARYRSAVSADPSNTLYRRLLAEVLIAQNKAQEGVEALGQVIQSGDPVADKRHVHWARRALAGVMANSGSYVAFNKALSLVEENADANGQMAPEDLAVWVAFCFGRSERESWDRALIRLEQVENQRPLSDTEMFMRAQLYEKFDDEALWDQAKSIAVNVMTENKENTKVADTFVKWLLKRGELATAQKIADNRLPAESVTRLRVRLHALAKGGKVEQALASLNDQAPKQLASPKDLSDLLTVATVAEELGQYEPKFYGLAIQGYQKLQQKAPREVLRLASALGLYGSVDNIRQALKVCRDAHKAGLKAEACTGVALAILRKHQDKWNGDLKQDVEQTSQWLTSLASSSPDDVKLRWRLAEYHDMMGNLDLVETEYQNILDSPGFTNPIDRGMLLNNLAYAMALNGKADKPASLIKEAKELIGPTSDVIDTEGFIHYLQGKNQLALVSIKQAIKSGPVTAQKYLHLTLVLLKTGDQKGAKDAWANAWKAGLTKAKLPPALHDEFDQVVSALGGATQS